jgi:Lamin Tail Domain
VKHKTPIFCAAALILSAGPSHAHLMITEVGYDPVDETSPTAEFVEIMNPGPSPVSLANVWLANDEEAYPLLVNGPITTGITSGDFVYRFPAITLEPGRVLVVCQDSDAFLAEHFGGGPLSFFTDQPGHPLLVEVTDDGIADGVPAMIDWGSYPSGTMSMANNGESVGLVEWDGTSDRIADHDWVCWLTLNNIPNKDVDYPFGVDGPDPDFETSFFLEDLGTAIPAPDAPEGKSIHRISLAEPGEATSGGNGIGGHDETTEDWSGWLVDTPSPGVTLLGTVSVETGPAGPGPRLLGVFPNPVAATTRIRYSITRPGRVRLTVLDPLGRTIATLVDDEVPPGDHVATWDRHGNRTGVVAPGIYFVRVRSGQSEASLPIVVVR